MDHLEAIANPSTFVCPDCRGSLWEVEGTLPPRYRCHTGHAFSLRSLQQTQSEETEAALWGAIRGLAFRPKPELMLSWSDDAAIHQWWVPRGDVGGAQRGPFALEEVVQQLARGEIDTGTRIWNMQWNPRADKWKTIGDMPEVMEAAGAAIPDPDDGIPDPE